MFLTSTKTNENRRKIRLKELEDSSIKNRKAIDGKLKEANAVDAQLAKTIEETRDLTSAIQKKISARLKITRKTLKNIVINMREGVILLDYNGAVIELNAAFSATFLEKDDEIMGLNFKDVCKKLNPTTEDGLPFTLTPNFRDLAESIFKNNNSPVIQPEIMIEVHPKNVESFKCMMTLSTLDNDPETVQDVSFMMFFRCLKRLSDRKRQRSSVRHAKVELGAAS